ncbi:MAG: hypothetical protein WA057_03305 [Candidatus Magasanikiibacteriota bacterium]
MLAEQMQNLSQIAILVGVVISGLGGYGHFYYGKMINNSKNMIENNYLVTNNGNNYGLMAGQINIGQQDRKLSPQFIEKVQTVLPEDKNKYIYIIRIVQDGESLQLAEQVKEHLLSLGYVNTSIPQNTRTYNDDFLNRLKNDLNITVDVDGKLKEIIIAPRM